MTWADLHPIHFVPLNRSTQYDNRASKAFSAMYAEIQNRVAMLRTARPQVFSLPPQTSPFLEMPDAHSVAVVASHEGKPLSRIEIGPHDIHGVTAQVNEAPLTRYSSALSDLVARL